MTEITSTVGVRASARKRVVPAAAIPLATLIALVTVGWEHVYHTMGLGLDASLVGHLLHVLRDTALVWPLALVAATVGLRSRRLTAPLARAAGSSVVLALLLVPAAAIHERIDGAGGGAHHHHE